MPINIDQDNLKESVLGLVLALVEIIKDVLKTEALRRMEGGRLTEAEIERLGKALMDLDQVIEEIKEEHGIVSAVASVREGLDGLVGDLLTDFTKEER